MTAKRIIIAATLLVGTLVALLARPASADPITAGETVAPDVFTTSPGTSLATEGFSFNANDFTYTVWVYQVPSAAPSDGLCVGCLNYVITVHTDPGATINQISLSDFAGYSLDVGYNTELGFGQTGAPVSVTASSNGSTITFNYGAGTLDVQGTTDFLEIETNATTYGIGGVCGVDAGSTVNCGSGYDPAAVPEPASLALLGSALIALGVIRYRGRKKAAAAS